MIREKFDLDWTWCQFSWTYGRKTFKQHLSVITNGLNSKKNVFNFMWLWLTFVKNENMVHLIEKWPQFMQCHLSRVNSKESQLLLKARFWIWKLWYVISNIYQAISSYRDIFTVNFEPDSICIKQLYACITYAETRYIFFFKNHDNYNW